MASSGSLRPILPVLEIPDMKAKVGSGSTLAFVDGRSGQIQQNVPLLVNLSNLHARDNVINDITFF